MNTEQRIKRDLIQMTIVAGIVIMALLGIMMFSPLAIQFPDKPEGIRGTLSDWRIDSLVVKKDYQEALSMVDSMMKKSVVEPNRKGIV